MTTADANPRSTATPVAVQILTVIFYAGFAISVSIVAMAMFGLIGVALALFLAWQWARIAAFGPRDTGTPAQHRAAAPSPTGNAAFDGYRDETLARLEAEQAEFTAFLDRLRQARDAGEFQDFLARRSADRT
jgi:hypothetical protein